MASIMQTTQLIPCSPAYIVVTSQDDSYLDSVKLNGSTLWFEIFTTVQIVLGALMCVLVTTRCIRDALQMYGAIGLFRLNCYMNVLLREGMTYFLACVLVFSIFASLVANHKLTTD